MVFELLEILQACGGYKKKIWSNDRFVKIHIQLKKKKKLLSGVVALVYKQVCCQILSKV